MMEVEYLKQALEYCDVTGVFTWKVRPIHHFCDERASKIFNSNFAGKVAGSVHSAGYCEINISGKQHKAHRLAFLYMGSDMPIEVDHINGDRFDNSWHNLREVSHSQNMRNRSMLRNNTSGVTGVSFDKYHNKWAVRVGPKVNSKHEDFFEAVCRRKSMEIYYEYSDRHGSKEGV